MGVSSTLPTVGGRNEGRPLMTKAMTKINTSPRSKPIFASDVMVQLRSHRVTDPCVGRTILRLAASGLLCNSQFGAACPAIGSDLFPPGRHRLLGPEAIDAFPLPFPEVALHQAVFETVITDDGDVAILSQQTRRRQQQLPQIVQLVVDGNPQGLKRSRRRMPRLMLAAGRPQGTRHDRGQLSRGRDRLTLPMLHDVPCDPPRRPILSILEDQVCQRFFVVLVDYIGRRDL